MTIRIDFLCHRVINSTYGLSYYYLCVCLEAGYQHNSCSLAVNISRFFATMKMKMLMMLIGQISTDNDNFFKAICSFCSLCRLIASKHREGEETENQPHQHLIPRDAHMFKSQNTIVHGVIRSISKLHSNITNGYARKRWVIFQASELYNETWKS